MFPSRDYMDLVKRWTLNFVVSTLVVGAVWAFFEYLLFGGLRGDFITFLGFSLPKWILISAFLGVAFASAQTVMFRRAPLTPVSAVASQPVSKKKAAKKKGRR